MGGGIGIHIRTYCTLLSSGIRFVLYVRTYVCKFGIGITTEIRMYVCTCILICVEYDSPSPPLPSPPIPSPHLTSPPLPSPPELAQAVVDAGAVQMLVLCLQEPEISLKRISASALSDISKHSPEVCGTICTYIRTYAGTLFL